MVKRQEGVRILSLMMASCQEDGDGLSDADVWQLAGPAADAVAAARVATHVAVDTAASTAVVQVVC